MNQENKTFYEISKEKYIIAGVNVGMILRKGGVIETQAQKYRADFEGYPQIVLGIDDETLTRHGATIPQLSLLEHEYMWTGAEFSEQLLNFDGFMLHASAVVYENKAYLFSAPSGTGKSTHTSVWQKTFGEDKTFILNDDKPVIRVIGGEIFAFGTPWSGKTDRNENVGVPLQGICFVERCETNWIEPMSPKDAIQRILDQTIRPKDVQNMTKLLELLENVLTKVKVHTLHCNMENEAAIVAYNGMNK
ncbi:MAG: hypothetical protein IJ285_05550 [Clostridia bacterium]|nr:hypothetical protein [Clostridia bacterium]